MNKLIVIILAISFILLSIFMIIYDNDLTDDKIVLCADGNHNKIIGTTCIDNAINPTGAIIIAILIVNGLLIALSIIL